MVGISLYLKIVNINKKNYWANDRQISPSLWFCYIIVPKRKIVILIKKQLTRFERAARREGVPGVGLGTGADRSQSAQVAVRVHTARVRARVDASVVNARRLVAGALAVRGALGRADAVRVAEVSLTETFSVRDYYILFCIMRFTFHNILCK